MWDKVRKRIVDACDVMDMVMAAVVVIGIVIAVIGIFPQIGELWRHREEMVAFLEFLDAVLGVVIGVEFLKMLCKPNTANIIEALIFVIARHMIVQTTTAGEDLVSVISICMLSFSAVLCLRQNRTRNIMCRIFLRRSRSHSRRNFRKH